MCNKTIIIKGIFRCDSLAFWPIITGIGFLSGILCELMLPLYSWPTSNVLAIRLNDLGASGWSCTAENGIVILRLHFCFSDLLFLWGASGHKSSPNCCHCCTRYLQYDDCWANCWANHGMAVYVINHIGCFNWSLNN